MLAERETFTLTLNVETLIPSLVVGLVHQITI